jgi:ABC-type uncharacterized transport system permease subunit
LAQDVTTTTFTGRRNRGAFSAGALRPVVMTVVPVMGALLVSAIVLLLVGVNPLTYYGLVIRGGLLRSHGLEETLTRMGPLMLLGSSLLVSFRAGIWNLGTDGQFLLGALATAVCAPYLVERMPLAPALGLSMAFGSIVGGAWALLPALLRAYQGVNEVITSLMMTFLGTALCAVLIKLFFRDPNKSEPETTALSLPHRLPHMFGTTVTSGVAFALAVLVVTHLILAHTSWGLRIQILGANPSAARHAGFNITWMTTLIFLASGALAGLAGATDLVGSLGSLQANWTPDYGMTVVPIVFLSRLNGWTVIVAVFVFSMLSIGSRSASLLLGVPLYYNLAFVGLLLIFFALIEYLDKRRQLKMV